MQNWSLYLIRTRHASLYAGITTDVERRFRQHERGSGAKYLRSKGPLQLVYQVQLGCRALALRAEHRIRMLPKREKEQIVCASPDASTLLLTLGLN